MWDDCSGYGGVDDFGEGARKRAIIPSNASALAWRVLLDLSSSNEVNDVDGATWRGDFDDCLVLPGRFDDLLVGLLVVRNPSVSCFPFPGCHVDIARKR